jgi:hypothetical protein
MGFTFLRKWTEARISQLKWVLRGRPIGLLRKLPQQTGITPTYMEGLKLTSNWVSLECSS